MKEKVQVPIVLPPPWCSDICRNSMNDVCVEECALKRDCSHFELREDVTLDDLPKYPLSQTNGMTRNEKFISLAVYVAKITEALKGDKNGTDHDYPPSRRILKAFQKQGVLPDPQERNTPYPDWSKRESVGVGPNCLDTKKEE